MNDGYENEEDQKEGQSKISYQDETVIWESSPSQWVNLSVFIGWGCLLFFVFIFYIYWNENLMDQYSDTSNSAVNIVLLILSLLSFFKILLSILSIKCEKTTITKNKIKESRGITSIFRKELYCEISDILDIKSPPAGIMGLLGLATLVLETQDSDQPIIKIRAIKNRDELINILQPLWRNLRINRKSYFGDKG